MGGCEFKFKNHQDQELTLKNFELISVVGQGGFGKVYKARLAKTHQLLALKIMSKVKIIQKRSVNSVMNELQLLQTLQHEFIVNIITAFQDRSTLYLAMDFMGGGDLRYHLCKNRRFSETIASKKNKIINYKKEHIAICIIIGLEYIHQNGVIHRDIKPENLVFDGNGYLRITDFGIARIWKPENSQETSGTPGYMAPEVMCRQNHGVGVDYYALGIILYESMIGRRPYNGKTRQEIRDQIIATQAKITESHWSEESIDFINNLIQRKPSQRLGLNGPEELKSHPWLRQTDWKAYTSKTPVSPFIPDDKIENYAKECKKSTENDGIIISEQMQQHFMGYEHGSQQVSIVQSPNSLRSPMFPMLSTQH